MLLYLFGILSFCSYVLIFVFGRNEILDNLNNNRVLYIELLLLINTGLFILLYVLRKRIVLRLNLKIIIIFSVLFCSTLFWQQSVFDSDINSYLLQGRMLTVYKENPYIAVPTDFPDDPFCAIVCSRRWGNTVSVYGPLWLYFTAATNYLSNFEPYFNIIVLKSLLVIIFQLCGYLIYKLLAQIRPEQKILGTLFFLWNPLLIFITASGGHNDILFIFFILLSCYALLKNQHLLAYGLLLGSFLVKLITLPQLFLLGLYIVYQKKYKLRWGLIIFFSTLGLICAAYLSIFDIKTLLPGLYLQSHLLNYLINLKDASISIALLNMLNYFTFNSHYSYINIIGNLVSGFALLLIFLNFKKNTLNFSNYLKAFFAIIFIILTVKCSWLMPWYYSWLIFLIPLLGYYRLGLYLTLVGILSYVLPTLSFAYLTLAILLLYIIFRIIKSKKYT